MPTPEPQTKIGKLTGDFLSLNESGDPDEVTIRQYLRDAKSLLLSDPAAAHSLLGIIYSVQEKHEEAVDHARIASSLESSEGILGNCAITFRHAGRLEESVELSRKLIRIAPTSMTSIGAFICSLCNCGRYIEASAYLHECDGKGILQQLYKSIKEIHPTLVKDVHEIATNMRGEGQIADGDMASLHELAWQFLADKKVQPAQIDTFIDHDDVIYVEAKLDRVPMEIADLNVELAELIADSDLPLSVMHGATYMFGISHVSNAS